MFRLGLDLFLLALAAVLVVVGLATWNQITPGTLMVMLAVGVLLIAPVGTRTAAAGA